MLQKLVRKHFPYHYGLNKMFKTDWYMDIWGTMYVADQWKNRFTCRKVEVEKAKEYGCKFYLADMKSRTAVQLISTKSYPKNGDIITYEGKQYRCDRLASECGMLRLEAMPIE
jgi:hypothetical protein